MQPSTDVYATHLPILMLLCSQMRVRTVLELGCGHYSTPFFLSLPDLTCLVSIETDEEWVARLTAEFDDDRLDMRLVDDAAQALDSIDLMGFDLILVDNGTTISERHAAINAVLTRRHPVVVVHDAEVEDYSDLLKVLAPKRETYRSRVPWTAVVR